MNDYTIVEKYQHGKNSTIAVRPFFTSNKENMGLEQYGLSLHDGVYHEENLACLEMNGVKRYVPKHYTYEKFILYQLQNAYQVRQFTKNIY